MGVTPNIRGDYRDYHSDRDSYDKTEKEDADLKEFERDKRLNDPGFKKWQKEREAKESTRNITPEEQQRIYNYYRSHLKAKITNPPIIPELALTSDPVVTAEPELQDSTNLPKHSVDENLSSQETRSDRIVSKKKMELSKKLLGPKKYNIFISFLKEQYPDDKLTNTKIVQKVTDLQKEYNTSHTDKPLIPDGVMGSKTYNAIINPIS